jgi:threonine dehydratase
MERAITFAPYATAKRMITKDDVATARERIRDHVHRTPLLTSARLAEKAGVARFGLKCESLQRTGSFKARGALNAMKQLSAADRARGVVTVSAGNHAQALAWASSLVGTKCIAVMPEGASRAKIEATEGYGGTVELVSGERKRAFERAREIAAQGKVMVHPFKDENVAAGQGTVALEILEQQTGLSGGVVVVPIGGGGLIAGMAVALRNSDDSIRIVGVEPTGAATMRASLDAGTPQNITPSTVADGLAAPMVGEMTLDVVRRHVDDVVLVTDEEILDAMRELMRITKLVVEPAGAAAAAALLSRKIPLDKRASAVAVISGGNVDLDRLKTLL